MILDWGGGGDGGENIKSKEITPTTASQITYFHTSIYVQCGDVRIEILRSHTHLYMVL